VNNSPWYVQTGADHERQRIRDDMKQIRLEQKAMKAGTATAPSPRSRPMALRAIRLATLAVVQAFLGMFA
jgi:hypothetical protein